jgi:hypothetical protein
MERAGNGEDAGELFRQVSAKMRPVLGADSTITTEEYLYDAINLIEACQQQVEAEFLLSKNESVEDISTSTLQVCTLCLGLCVSVLFSTQPHTTFSPHIVVPFPGPVHWQVLLVDARYGEAAGGSPAGEGQPGGLPGPVRAEGHPQRGRRTSC